ncbi:glutathione amide-dependent peroxidase-like [Hibiscus syriacus]|uniref:glutathione amide-dependent peroxidase-like n=1 Tax=Hibiscus syriacus TaxID=106335 RepID=UPI001923D518|nr:glutathione amide-dependent peroxidase-like [Hibiscus syriacus]
MSSISVLGQMQLCGGFVVFTKIHALIWLKASFRGRHMGLAVSSVVNVGLSGCGGVLKSLSSVGAYVGVCSQQHVPSYMKNIDKFKAKEIDSVICVFVNDPYAMNAWERKLRAKDVNEFPGSTKVIVVKLQALRNQFETLFMKNNETVHDFLSRVTTITSKMKAYGEQITDETIVSKVLRSLPSKFDHVVTAIEESTDFSVFSFDELMGSLQSHELINDEAEVECVVEVEAKVGNKVEANVGNDHNIEIASNATIMESLGILRQITGKKLRK